MSTDRPDPAGAVEQVLARLRRDPAGEAGTPVADEDGGPGAAAGDRDADPGTDTDTTPDPGTDPDTDTRIDPRADARRLAELDGAHRELRRLLELPDA